MSECRPLCITSGCEEAGKGLPEARKERWTMDASAAAREASYWRSDIVANRPLLPAKGARASRRCRHQHRARVARRNRNAKAGLGACESSLQPYYAGAAMQRM